MELILTIAVTAIVMVAITGVFFSAVRLRESTTAAVDASLPIQHTLATMRRDLENAVPTTTNGVLSGDFKVGGVASLGIGQPVDIELYTTTGSMREDQPWGDIQRVTYELRRPADNRMPGKDLIRSVTRNLLADVTPQPQDQWMMGGVDSLTFSCYDGSGWYDTWDSTVTTNIPTAVRVEIYLAANNGGRSDEQPIQMVVPIDCQAPTNMDSTDTTSSGGY